MMWVLLGHLVQIFFIAFLYMICDQVKLTLYDMVVKNIKKVVVFLFEVMNRENNMSSFFYFLLVGLATI